MNPIEFYFMTATGLFILFGIVGSMIYLFYFMIPDTPFQRELANMYACKKARIWVGRKTPQKAWDKCKRVDWMLFLIRNMYLCGYVSMADLFATRDLELRNSRPKDIKALFPEIPLPPELKKVYDDKIHKR